MEPPEEEDWDAEPPSPEWGHFVTQLNQDPGDGSTTDSGLGTVAMEEEGAEADTAGDEEVEGMDGKVAVDVALDVTDDLTWHASDPYLETDELGDALSPSGRFYTLVDPHRRYCPPTPRAPEPQETMQRDSSPRAWISR